MSTRRVIRGIDVTGRRKPDSELRYPYRRIGGEHVHRRIVEQRIGMKLPSTAEVHHVNPDDKLTNNGPFVVCQDKAYHKLIEYRSQALAACGHAGWRRCRYCGKWDDPENMRKSETAPCRRGYVRTIYNHGRFKGKCVNNGERCVTFKKTRIVRTLEQQRRFDAEVSR